MPQLIYVHWLKGWNKDKKRWEYICARRGAVIHYTKRPEDVTCPDCLAIRKKQEELDAAEAIRISLAEKEASFWEMHMDCPEIQPCDPQLVTDITAPCGVYCRAVIKMETSNG